MVLRARLLTDWPSGSSTPLYSDPERYNRAFKSIFVSGWPMHALWCQPRMGSANDLPVDYGVWLGEDRRCAIVLAGVRPFRMPLHPLWPGFVVNSMLFASVWGITLLGPGQVRRFIRRERSLCPHCAYDLRATPVGSPCPECGKLASR